MWRYCLPIRPRTALLMPQRAMLRPATVLLIAIPGVIPLTWSRAPVRRVCVVERPQRES